MPDCSVPFEFLHPFLALKPSTKDISELLGSKTHQGMFPNFLVHSLCKDEEWAVSS